MAQGSGRHCVWGNERLWSAAPVFSSWVCPVYPNKAVCDRLRRMPSFLALETRESCSHAYKQRGRSRCYSSCCSWYESSDESPALFGCCTLISAFGGCRVGIPSAAEGSAGGQGRTYIPSEWAVEKAGGKQENLGHIAMSCRKITGISQNWYSMWWCAIYDEVPQCIQIILNILFLQANVKIFLYPAIWSSLSAWRRENCVCLLIM